MMSLSVLQFSWGGPQGSEKGRVNVWGCGAADGARLVDARRPCCRSILRVDAMPVLNVCSEDADELGSLLSGKLTLKLPRDRQQVLGGAKRREWSRRSPRDTETGKGARLEWIHLGLEVLSPRAGAAMLGRATLSRRKCCRCGPCTLARTSLLRNYGRTGPPDKGLNLLRPRTRAAHSEMRRESYTELPEEGTLREKGGKLT